MGETKSTPRDDMRKRFKDSGLTYDILTKETLARLRRILDAQMRASGLFRGYYRAPRAAVLKHMDDGRKYAAIRCNSDYFTGRQAVSFESDGFVGFAGWADGENLTPILEGFAIWMDEMTATQV